MNKPNGKPSSIGAEMIRGMNELIETLKAGGMPAVEKKFRVTRLTRPGLPKPVSAISPKRVKIVRSKVGASQPVFAALIGVSPQTVKAWEQGSKKPSGAARRMLSEIDVEPAYWLRRMAQLAGK